MSESEVRAIGFDRHAQAQEIQAEAIYEKRQDFGTDWRKLNRWCLQKAAYWRAKAAAERAA